VKRIKDRILYHLTYTLIIIFFISFFKSLGINGYSLNTKPSNFFDNLLNYEDYFLIVLIMNIVLFFWGDK